MDWRTQAACRGTPDPDLFFPLDTTGPAAKRATAAKAICARCPVLPACRTWASVMWISAGRRGGDQGLRVRDMSVTPGDAYAARAGSLAVVMNTVDPTKTDRRVRTRWRDPLVKDMNATDVHDGPIDAWNRTSRTSRTGLEEIHITLASEAYGIWGGLTEHERARLRRATATGDGRARTAGV